MPDYFIGVSAGIAYGVSYLSGQKGRNLEIIKRYMSDKRYMGFRYLFDRNLKSFYNIPFVFGEVPNKLLPFDEKAFASFPGEIEAVVTNIRTGKAEYLKVPRNDRKFGVRFRAYFSQSKSERGTIWTAAWGIPSPIAVRWSRAAIRSSSS